MPHFIKAGFWEKTKKGLKGWLNLDDVIRNVVFGSTKSIEDGTTVVVSSGNQELITSNQAISVNITYSGDSTLRITLNAEESILTFPSNSLCVAEGEASGDNTITLSGEIGDNYIIGIKEVAGVYFIVSKNFGQ